MHIDIARDVEQVLEDGTVLRSDVYRRAGDTAPAPVLLRRTAYSKTRWGGGLPDPSLNEATW